MADDIGYITFKDVSMSDGAGHTEAFSQTTLQIDYTTNTVSVVGGGALTFNGVSYTSFNVTPLTVNGATHYVLTSDIGSQHALELNYAGQSPSAFGSLSVAASPNGAFTSFVTNTITPAICFAAGTLIRTPAGDVPVETLKRGDVVLTASGDMRPVKWVGHTEVDFRLTPNGSPGLPIRIAAGAFGASRPSQDLYLSAGHSVCLDLVGETLIPIGYMANGAAIAKVEVDQISYWHVELDSHDILIANNLATESYLAMGNRGSFEEMRGLLPAFVEGRERSHADFCRPVVTEGPVLDFVRRRLLARAEEIGWAPMRDSDLRLVVDGQTVRPQEKDGAATFLFPASAEDVRLMSSTFDPTEFGSDDRRKLGVMLSELSFYGSDGGEPRRISLDDERLTEGMRQLESHAGEQRRWTKGEARLDPRFWDGLLGEVALLVNYDRTTVRGWTAPVVRSEGVKPKLQLVRERDAA